MVQGLGFAQKKTWTQQARDYVVLGPGKSKTSDDKHSWEGCNLSSLEKLKPSVSINGMRNEKSRSI
jgi:hypothetical protein